MWDVAIITSYNTLLVRHCGIHQGVAHQEARTMFAPDLLPIED